MKSGSQSVVRIAITSGDVDGVGLEVSAKALAKVRMPLKTRLFLWRARGGGSKKDLKLIDRSYNRITVHTWAEALNVKTVSCRDLVDIESDLPPAIWVDEMARSGMAGDIAALVTAPLSKGAVHEAGLADMGHTGILRRISGQQNLFMGFIGDKFNVLIATDHIALSDVEARLTQERLKSAISAACRFRDLLPKKLAAKPLGLLGLNPHSGEGGLIGRTEGQLHAAVLLDCRKRRVAIEGPLVPDAAFLKDNWKKYSVYVANYHDQGLIPFKMIHGQDSGFHITLGLPFLRTSVDHGTAKDIFGQNRADSRSMTLALEWAIKSAPLKTGDLNL